MRTKTQTRIIIYSDWDIMIRNTESDCEFLVALEVYYTYEIFISKHGFEVEFKLY